MTPLSPAQHVLRVADLQQSRPTPFSLAPKGSDLDALRDGLDLLDLRKLRFEGQLRPLGARDWELTATLGATVIQPCVATLAPVTTRIDTKVTRQFLADFEDPDDPESEMPEDDSVQALGSSIDLGAVLQEALSLALPLYPRAADEGPVHLAVTEPGQDAMTDEDARPFAALAALKQKLTDPETKE